MESPAVRRGRGAQPKRTGAPCVSDDQLGRAALWAARLAVLRGRRLYWPPDMSRDDVIQEVAILTTRRLARWLPGGRKPFRKYACYLANLALVEVVREEWHRRRRRRDVLDIPENVTIEQFHKELEKAA